VALPDVGPRVLLELESGAASAKWARATGGCASATPPPALRTWCSPLSLIFNLQLREAELLVNIVRRVCRT